MNDWAKGTECYCLMPPKHIQSETRAIFFLAQEELCIPVRILFSPAAAVTLTPGESRLILSTKESESWMAKSSELHASLAKRLLVSGPTSDLSSIPRRRDRHCTSVQPERKLWEKVCNWFPVLLSRDLPERVSAFVRRLIIVLKLNPKNLTSVWISHRNEFL